MPDQTQPTPEEEQTLRYLTALQHAFQKAFMEIATDMSIQSLATDDQRDVSVLAYHLGSSAGSLFYNMLEQIGVSGGTVPEALVHLGKIVHEGFADKVKALTEEDSDIELTVVETPDDNPTVH